MSASDFKRDLLRTKAQVYFQHAVEPLQAQQQERFFGGDGEPVTFEDVEAEFGEAAALDWKQARDAKTRFFGWAYSHINRELYYEEPEKPTEPETYLTRWMRRFCRAASGEKT